LYPESLLLKSVPSNEREKMLSVNERRPSVDEVLKSESASVPNIILLTGKRDVKLLSFGEDQDGEEEPVTFKKRIARPDCKCTMR
jgi:hypothetical protein